jgi:DNA-binding NtrC family response regulator
MAPQARQLLLNHHWRGNVRELENTMHRAVLLAREGQVTEESIMLTGEMLPAEGTQSGESGTQQMFSAGGVKARDPKELVGQTVAAVERDLILDTLQHCLGNRTHAANILGISIRTLRNKLKLYSEEGVAIPMPGEAERTLA